MYCCGVRPHPTGLPPGSRCILTRPGTAFTRTPAHLHGQLQSELTQTDLWGAPHDPTTIYAPYPNNPFPLTSIQLSTGLPTNLLAPLRPTCGAEGTYLPHGVFGNLKFYLPPELTADLSEPHITWSKFLCRYALALNIHVFTPVVYFM